MTDTKAIAIERAKPFLREAAERHEEILSNRKQWAELTGGMLDSASMIGKSLELARLALTAAKVDVAFESILEAHCPNIDAEQAKKYMRWAKGEITDKRQLCLPFEIKPADAEQEQREDRTKPAQWEQAWGYIAKLKRVFNPSTWPAQQKELARKELEPLMREVFPERWA